MPYTTQTGETHYITTKREWNGMTRAYQLQEIEACYDIALAMNGPTVTCAFCDRPTSSPILISNFAGGPANAVELVADLGCARECLDRAAAVLRVPAFWEGPFGEVLVDDDHFVKAQPVEVASALLAA